MRPILVDFLARFVGADAATLLAPTYFTMVALAGLATAVLMVRRARAEGDDVPTVITTLIVGYTGAVVGGILAPMIFDAGAQLVAGRTPVLRWAGMVAYGGFGFALAAIVVYLGSSGRARTLSLARFGDLAAPLVGLAVAIVRLGCFVAGCDYGKVTDVPWAVRFPVGSPAWRDHVAAGLVPAWRDASLPVHPTELYESLLGVLLFVAVLRLARTRLVRVARPGLLLPLVLAGYALGRSAIENLRGDASRGFLGPLSTSQVIGVLVLAFVAFVLWTRARATRAALVASMLLAVTATTVAFAPDAHAREWQGGVLIGTTNPFNRRAESVPQLVGVSLVFAFDAHAPLTLGAEVEAMSNSVAQHTSGVLELVWRAPLSPGFEVGARAGIGYTVIDFHDPSFDSLRGLDLRVMGTLDLHLGDAWTLSAWPLALESVHATDAGGPIVAYQFRIGLSYTFGRSAAPVVLPPQPAYPAAAPAPSPSPPTTAPTPDSSPDSQRHQP
jgi:phosphatidylglycerol:prolipoprotein diacylglycerol transferase